MKRFIIACLLLTLFGTEHFAQCPNITIDAGSPQDIIVHHCDDLDKKSVWSLHQGQFPGSLTSRDLGQCDGTTECWPAFYSPLITSNYFAQTTQINLARHRVDGPQFSGCRLGLTHTLRWDAICQTPVAGACLGPADWITFPSTGCITGLFFQGPCTRSTAFRSKCDEYVEEECSCTGGYMSPIVVDVDHSGFSMTDAPGGVVFDMLKDGVPLSISWTAGGSTNSLLALDRNANGTIDNGEELFGDITPQPATSAPNGFLALAEYDKSANGGNGNDRIDRHDAIFSQLKLWRDGNHNGISESSELQPLSGLLRAIDLDYKESRRTDQHGNQFRYRAKVYDLRGAQAGRWAWDVFLTVQ